MPRENHKILKQNTQLALLVTFEIRYCFNKIHFVKLKWFEFDLYVVVVKVEPKLVWGKQSSN